MTPEQELYIYKWTAKNGFYSPDNSVGWIGKFFYRHDKKYTILYNTLTLKGSNIKLFKDPGNIGIFYYKFSQGLKCNITMDKLMRAHETMEKFLK